MAAQPAKVAAFDNGETSQESESRLRSSRGIRAHGMRPQLGADGNHRTQRRDASSTSRLPPAEVPRGKRPEHPGTICLRFPDTTLAVHQDPLGCEARAKPSSFRGRYVTNSEREKSTRSRRVVWHLMLILQGEMATLEWLRARRMPVKDEGPSLSVVATKLRILLGVSAATICLTLNRFRFTAFSLLSCRVSQPEKSPQVWTRFRGAAQPVDHK